MDYSLLTKEKISQKYNSLAQELRGVLSSADTLIVIENIAAKYRLDEEKNTMLIQLVGLVILGFVSFEDMKEEMKETIDISPQFIPLIAEEIRQKIFSPVINSLQKVINTPTTPAPAMPAAPVAPVPTPAPLSPRPITPLTVSTPAKPVDEYREPTFSAPEVVDLRKTPPAVSKVEPPPAPSLPPKPMTVPPAPIMPTPSAPKPLTSPLTFTRPIEPVAPKPVPPTPTPAPIAPKPTPLPTAPAPIIPLIEAEPHKIPSSAPRPQYIIRPSGAPPTDRPENILDLKQDRGEF